MRKQRWRSDELERLRAEDGMTYSLEFSQPVFQGDSAYYRLKDACASTQAQRLFEKENWQSQRQNHIRVARDICRRDNRKGLFPGSRQL